MEQFLKVNSRLINTRTIYTIDKDPESGHRIEITHTNTTDRHLLIFANEVARNAALNQIINELTKGFRIIKIRGATVNVAGPFIPPQKMKD